MGDHDPYSDWVCSPLPCDFFSLRLEDFGSSVLDNLSGDFRMGLALLHMVTVILDRSALGYQITS